MNTQYIGDDFIIDCQEHSITIKGERHDVRPKTFQLLLALIKQQNTIIDKQTLLNDIWSDVAVDEQVIFQSIGEIRKIFADKKVIQTHPRKGYSWVAPITLSQANTTQKTPEITRKPPKYPQYRFLLNISLITFFLALTVYLYSSSSNELATAHQQNTAGTVFILPTKNKIQDNNFDWVSIGIMDTLISQTNDHSKVMPLDYVLLSMRNANMNRDYTKAHIERLFKITRASVIVESEISRRLDQYQLIYKLHFFDKAIVQEVLFSHAIDTLVEKLADIIAEATDANVEFSAMKNTTFNHELFVEAISLSHVGKLDAGIQLLRGLIAIEPNNLQAHKVLIDWLQYQGKYQDALNISEQALIAAQQLNTDKAAIYYRHAYSFFRLNNLTQAQHFLILLKQALVNEKNPYYQGYSLQLQGELLLAQGSVIQAKSAFTQALKQFESISFSIGMTSLHILLSETENSLGNDEQSLYHIKKAKQIVDKHEISHLLSSFKINLE